MFNDQVSTSGLRCVEMRERRPWRHHIDYFGVAATAYCLLVGKYLKVFLFNQSHCHICQSWNMNNLR